MGTSTYVFESGKPIAVGRHGDHSYVYQSGDPVLDMGASELVFESGVGLGGIRYEIDGAGLQPLEPIQTADTHAGFYDYTNNEAHHGYEEADVLTIFVHENTTDGSWAVIITAGNGDESSSIERTFRTDFTFNSGSFQSYLETDGEESDNFTSDYMENGYHGDKTDGAAIEAASGWDVAFAVDDTWDSHSTITQTDSHNDLRVIYEDGSAPDGGAVEYAGTPNATVRLVFP